ncbi:Dinitrogenase iron-molybdenum cofactor biosynthesis protein [Rhodomicrobium vannielii ATCC 17100]|uniref:Dinitrogenase iron-molybdenum cofactor biosynthesis protein n=1 Tax=Rhodomicrobium vannielii (strain ATCC 17100 / DSM 162 / LMG 4299 / NCIMB 10020 / ATH 3.1.1) TaxID=648757 RepID=E3HZB8_RHOVT|nr:NifB/NifX family molybdenum-iron cluster-binding protein [Rhodomicrobium vannielii]ADP69864.1 Dinitrogenase iron-molybdenum cofactor biosynthesis protein [Rhodomicrobium vannielii ATCC 17100]
MKIGVTSQNFRTITGHAGKARRFMVFEAASDNWIVLTGTLDLPMEMSIHEHPAEAAHPLDGIDALITASCGGGFAKRLAERGVRVILTSETDPMTAVTALLSGAALPAPAADDHDHDNDHEACGCHCSGTNPAAG